MTSLSPTQRAGDGVDYSKIRRLLTVCRDIEKVMAQVYESLAAAHADNEIISKVWAKAAREELGHASQLDLAMRVSRGTLIDTRFDLDRATHGLQVANKVLASIRATPPSIGYALREAVRMEKTFIQFHTYYAGEFADGSTKRLFESLRAADEQHVKDLEHALEVVQQLGLS